ncbi:MAG: hypothetical protein V4718_17130 [Pseudomonadota bacterium]
MIFDVYVYQDDPVDALSSGPKTGELILKSTGRDDGVTASLYEPGTDNDLIRTMRRVRLVAMNKSSFVIEGTITASERNSPKSKTHSFQVQWVIKHVGAPAVVNVRRLQQRSAARLARASGGFDPADDNQVM